MLIEQDTVVIIIKCRTFRPQDLCQLLTRSSCLAQQVTFCKLVHDSQLTKFFFFGCHLVIYNTNKIYAAINKPSCTRYDIIKCSSTLHTVSFLLDNGKFPTKPSRRKQTRICNTQVTTSSAKMKTR